jgi:non-canonical purine NTP pyrophosphatase (RdgB/HAM1 family)
VELKTVFVTGRPEKVEEAARLGFAVAPLPLELPELQAVDPGDVVEEKARAAYARLSRPVIVEDSGLEIAAWGGFPGALVKWLEKTAGVEKITRMLDGFPDRSARAVCAVAYFDGAAFFHGRGHVDGEIAPRPRGSGGFGWDSIFIPRGETRTFAQMPPADKDRRSHRRRAWEALVERVPAERLR